MSCYNMGWSKKIAIVLGIPLSPPLYLSCHFVYYAVTHFMAIICFHYFIVSFCMAFTMSVVVLWNGACYYMDYFAKRYESHLAQYSEFQKEISTKKESPSE